MMLFLKWSAKFGKIFEFTKRKVFLVCTNRIARRNHTTGVE
jgi:hypothetical protein